MKPRRSRALTLGTVLLAGAAVLAPATTGLAERAGLTPGPICRPLEAK